MPNFIPYDYNQSSMVVINYLDQLHPGTFEHAIHFLVTHKLDLSVYFTAYKKYRQWSASLRSGDTSGQWGQVLHITFYFLPL